jgi:diaminopimelate epimerase
MDFYKYQGTGNDFIMIDDRKAFFDTKDHQKIASLCDRRFGIGADGLILIRNHKVADFEMIYFNSDGHLTSLCGNGSRCAVKFARQLGIIQDQCSFQTVEGMLEASISDELIHLKMPDVPKAEVFPTHYFIDSGSPHHICFVNDVESHNVFEEGQEIRYGASYKRVGTNVNFVQELDNHGIFVRTYERGVENETLSCGTGVTAAALAQSLRGTPSPIEVQTLGGNLKVSFERTLKGGFSNIYLIGPAELVFSGQIG